jgi:hypothetical protein
MDKVKKRDSFNHFYLMTGQVLVRFSGPDLRLSYLGPQKSRILGRQSTCAFIVSNCMKTKDIKATRTVFQS